MSGGGALNRKATRLTATGACTSLGYYQGSCDTVKTLAQIIGAAIPTGALSCIIVVTAQAIRWVSDTATTPSATLGMPLPVNTMLEFNGDLSQFKAIAQSAGAVFNVEFYG